MSDCAIPNCGKPAPVDDAFCAEHGGRRRAEKRRPTLTEDAILTALRRYKVHNHYKGTASGRRAVYAVFGPSGQASETMGHAEAVAMRDQLIARDILAMLE